MKQELRKIQDHINYVRDGPEIEEFCRKMEIEISLKMNAQVLAYSNSVQKGEMN